MREYLNMLGYVLKHGEKRGDRTGVGTRSVFGYQIKYDLFNSFPLLTTKKVNFNAIVHELLWFLNGDTNTKYLNDNGVHIWDEWADTKGNLGPIYGKQWRGWYYERGKTWGYIDQIEAVVESLKENPYSRRHIVSAWNVAEIDSMALPPCHVLFQFYVRDMKNSDRVIALNRRDGLELPVHGLFSAGIPNQTLDKLGAPSKFLDVQLYQRSADIFLGVPFNIASYSLLTMMIARGLGYEPGTMVHTFGDLHLYNNHIEQARTQLERVPGELPTVVLPYGVYIDDYAAEDIRLVGYDPQPYISAPIAV